MKTGNNQSFVCYLLYGATRIRSNTPYRGNPRTLQVGCWIVHTVGPVIIEFFRVEIGQFKISSDKFANDSVRFKKVQPKFVVAIQKAMLNLKKSTAIQSKSS